jgi:hypothetical protein
MKISVLGLGKLGAPLAAVLASKRFDVVGVDLSQTAVEALNARKAPVEEPRLQELIDAHGARLKATTNVDEAVAATDVTFVIVPTPSDATGRFSNAAVLSAMKSIGLALRRKDTYHIVVITSTVMPGSTGGEIQQALEQHAGRRVGSQLGLCYNPEFIALGSVIRDFLNPDFLLIGESDQRAGDVLSDLYRQVCDNDAPIARMNFVNAELAKIADFEIGLDGDGKFFFRNKTTGASPVLTLDGSNLEKVQSFSPGWDRVFNSIRATFGSYVQESNSTTEDTLQNSQRNNATNSSRVTLGPGLLVVATNRQGEGIYSSLLAAMSVAQDGDTIELDFDGRHEERPVSLANIKVSIRAAEGRRPILVFRPAESDADRGEQHERLCDVEIEDLLVEEQARAVEPPLRRERVLDRRPDEDVVERDREANGCAGGEYGHDELLHSITRDSKVHSDSTRNTAS